MARTLDSITSGPQTQNNFGIVSAATSLIQDGLYRGYNSIKNIIGGTSNSIVNIFK